MVATLLLGLAWGVWHVPLYGPLGFVVPLVLAFFYTWLYNRTSSVLLCILLHASFTPAQDHLVLLPDAVAAAEPLGTIDFVILGTYVAAVLLLVGLSRGRLGRRLGADNTEDGSWLETTRPRHEQPNGGKGNHHGQ